MPLTPATTHMQSSNSAFAISNLANGILVSEAVVTIPSTTYTVNAYLHGEMDSVGSEGNWQINACFYKYDGAPSSCSILTSGSAPPANWTQVSGTVPSPADAATMKLELVGAQLSGWLAWDDMSVSLDAQMITKYYYAGSQRVAVRKNGVLNYLLGDHLGSASVVTDADGSLLSKMLYKPWGEERYSSGVMPTDRLYTGQIAEPNLGLYFYNARWYDPALGRFAQADTIIPQPGNPQSWDRYSYGYNNPSRFTDPSGHFSQDEIMEYFEAETWEDVLNLFKVDGELEGRWGWLTVLQKAEVGDNIIINWDKTSLPSNHPDVGSTFQGTFANDNSGNLIIMGKDNYMDQWKAAKYGMDYQLMHYTSDDSKKAAAAFLIIATDITIGIPAFILMLSGQPPIMKAAEMLETFVVLPINILGIKMWTDADHGKLEEFLNISAIPNPGSPYPYNEVK